MKFDFMYIMFRIIFLVFILLGIIMFHAVYSEEYTTDKIVDCNDKDGDVIEDLVCYDVVHCADFLKFLNEEGCEDAIYGKEVEVNK